MDRSGIIEKIIENRSCWVEYQPIMDIKHNKVYGYEALARFYIDRVSYSPDKIFSACCDDKEKLLMLELLVKEYQFAYRPDDEIPIFVNISPESIASRECMNRWVSIFKNKKNLVVEITETYKKESIGDIETFAALLKENGITHAIDDLFKDYAEFTSSFISESPIIKIDKGFLDRAYHLQFYAELLKAIIKYGKRMDKIIIIEGIETNLEMGFVEKMDARYVQGFYFSDMFIT